MNENDVADRLLRGVENIDFPALSAEKLMARLRKLGAAYADSPQLETCHIEGGSAEERVHVFLDLYFMIVRLKFGGVPKVVGAPT